MLSKRIKYDRHAKNRMKWRRISEEEVMSVILEPDYRESTIKNRYNAFKKISGRPLKVTYKEFEDEIYVITAVVRTTNERIRQ